MFSPSQALRFEAPMPPMPIAAMFSLLLGACAPNTDDGTMAADTAARAAVDVNCRRVRVGVVSSFMDGSGTKCLLVARRGSAALMLPELATGWTRRRSLAAEAR